MIDIFKPEDFDVPLYAKQLEQTQRYVDIANAKLEKLLGPKVYGHCPGQEVVYIHRQQMPSDTHEAFLFDVKPIKKVCEKHEPAFETTYAYAFPHFTLSTCKNCGAKLKAKWEVVE